MIVYGLVINNDENYMFAQYTGTILENNSDIVALANNTDGFGTKLSDQSFNLSELNNSVKAVTYSPKYLCGNVSTNEGPVRPGHYDTDISILNKQDYPIRILWHVIPNNSNATNSIIMVLNPESSTGITCKDILRLVTNHKSLAEGFVLLSLPIEGSMINAFPDSNNPEASILRSTNGIQLNLIDVQVFYTANALPQLPTEMVFTKIDFRILNDSSEKIPQEMMRHELEIVLNSNINQIYDPVLRLKSLLKVKFGLTDTELDAIEIQIDSSNIDTLFTNDDHAISSSRLSPNLNLN